MPALSQFTLGFQVAKIPLGLCFAVTGFCIMANGLYWVGAEPRLAPEDRPAARSPSRHEAGVRPRKHPNSTRRPPLDGRRLFVLALAYLIRTFVAGAGSAFGRCTTSTPSRYSAVTFFSATGTGRRIVRANFPYTRSRTR